MPAGIAPGPLRAGMAVVALALLGVMIATSPARAGTDPTPDRYSLVHGCYGLGVETGSFVVKDGGGYRASAPQVEGAEPFRMQATDLGEYLFYGPAEDFLAIDASGEVAPADEPSPQTDWVVRRPGGSFTIYNRAEDKYLSVDAGGKLMATDEPGAFSFTPAAQCAEYPEVDVNASGRSPLPKPIYGETRGFVDAHMHHMAFEFLGGKAHCGRPWHRYGAPYALVDCPDHEPDGCSAVLENVLYGNPARCHDTVGWPTFNDWPHHKSLTHEGSYYRWLERAHRAGLRIFVNLLVDNRVLCELYPLKKKRWLGPPGSEDACNEMESARLQAKRMHQLQDYIDAQEGGPGEGWYRIVRNPFQARRVINQGDLAVVMGIELSRPFGCGRFEGETEAHCVPEHIESEIQQVWEMGVRQLELINKFDNGFAGVAGDGGTTGTITNNGNKYETNRYWDLETCEEGAPHDHSPAGPTYHNEDALVANGLELLPPGTLPVYPEPPHCNQLGLTAEGEFAVRELMERGMIFDPDHMSVLARQQALDVLEETRYSGVVSSHSWSTHDAYPRIYDLGGFIAPYAGGSQGFVDEWRDVAHHANDRYYFGFGYGADMNGFGSQGGPRGANVPNPVTYPFESYDGAVTFEKGVSGERVWDINVDGVAQYGLYADWIEDLTKVAGDDADELMRDMSRGAESYLQMWERAQGIDPVGCKVFAGDFSGRGGFDGMMRLRDRPRPLIRRAGQPQVRRQTWKWCAKEQGGAGSESPGVAAGFIDGQQVGLIASGMEGNEADGTGAGDSVERLRRGGAERLGDGLWVADAGPESRFVWDSRAGLVTVAGVADRSISHDPETLRRYMDRTGLG